MIEVVVNCPRCGREVRSYAVAVTSGVCIPCPGCGKGVDVELGRFETERGPVVAVLGVATFDPEAVLGAGGRGG